VRLTHTFEAMILDEFHDPSKARFQVRGQGLKLVSNAGVEQSTIHAILIKYCIFAIPRVSADLNV